MKSLSQFIKESASNYKRYYLVVPHYDYEGYGDPLRCFDNQSKATTFINKQTDKVGDSIEVIEVNAINGKLNKGVVYAVASYADYEGFTDFYALFSTMGEAQDFMKIKKMELKTINFEIVEIPF